MVKDARLNAAKQEFLENLDQLQSNLIRSVAEAMLDLGDEYYNDVLGLIEDGVTVDNWDELMEAITRAKTLENDIASWMSRHGRTTLSFTWPKKPK